MPYTYILLCSNNEYYVGSTFDLEKRLQEHLNGKGGHFTKFNRPVTLVYSEQYETISEAFRRERQLHGWSRRKKEALIRGDIDELKRKVHPEPAEGKEALIAGDIALLKILSKSK